MEEDKYSELSGHFTSEEWNDISEYEKLPFYGVLDNYKVTYSLGKSVQTLQILI